MTDALTDSTTVLAGQGIVLRNWIAADIDQVHLACQDPQTQRWTTVPSPYTRADAEQYVASSGERWSAGTPSFAVTDATGQRILGSLGFVAPPFRSVVEIGFWISPWSRGQGVAARATGAICDWAFDTLGLHRVEWQAEVGNDASRRVAEKSGFTFEGTLRGRGVHKSGPVDLWIAGLLSTDPRPWH